MQIDFVIPWVDGSDPEWQAEKAKYQKTKDDNNAINRYRDWGLMKYWFRSIEQFTPWVRKIHFITWGHVPEFLNCEHPKLHIVRHEEYMPIEALPTFSSHALEINLHRIKGLAEHFVYFNDDTFIIRPMKESDFFQNNLPCTFGAESPLELIGEIGAWQHAAVNDLGIVNKHFSKKEQIVKFKKKYVNRRYSLRTNFRTLAVEQLFENAFIGFRNLHAPTAYCKNTFKEVWAAEPEVMKRTTNNRFRTSDDVNQWVMLWWQVASGKFAPAVIDNKTFLANEKFVNEICQSLIDQRMNMICINDPDEDFDFKGISSKIQKTFEMILPNKSSFEK